MTLWALMFVLIAGCGGDDGPEVRTDTGPGGMDTGPGGVCAEDGACDDGTYCNGAERCAPEMPGADARGCVAGDPIDCDDGVACTMDVCSDERIACVHVPPDGDGDGHGDAACTDGGGVPIGDDCDDGDSRAFPGNAEVCDAHDEDCNPDTLGFLDADGDGSSSSACCNGTECGEDCNDGDATIRPGVADGPTMNCDTVDNDCDGGPDEGCPCVDGESMACGTDPELRMIGLCRPGMRFCVSGVFTDTCSGAVHPEEEICDGLDNDCDGTNDEAVERRYYRDGDGDGFGLLSEVIEACSAPMGYSPTPTDCDDTMAGVNPGAPEVCDGADNDCDGTPDDGLLRPFYRDVDGDGYGSTTMSTMACSAPTGHVADGTDCDDTVRAVHPGARDECNGGVDDDCDGTPDRGCTCRDGATQACGSSDVGECAYGTQRCIGGVWGECVGVVAPRTEICNTLDDDCDGMTDEMVTTTFYRDVDGDGFGLASATAAACTLPSGYASRSGDCDDGNVERSPAATERCNGVDDNCDGTADTGCTCTDGTTRVCGMDTGECTAGRQTCIGGIWAGCAGSVDPRTEICNGLDDDCDSTTDEMLTVTCYLDADADAYGAGAAIQRCPDPARPGMCPSGYGSVAGDCNDASGAIRPGAAESCNGIDDDCDGMTDEMVRNTYYRDADADGFGVATTTMTGCVAPAGYVAATGDCDDTNAARFPGAFEVCDGRDDDCDGVTTDEPMRTFYRDMDGDLYGVAGTTMMACSPPGGYVETAGDCDDTDAAERPGAPELCDGSDDDCDGISDDGAAAQCGAQNPLAINVSSWACTAGACVPNCTGAWRNCDASVANGCEIDTSSDEAHCGTCTTVCGPASACTASSCQGITDLYAAGHVTCVIREGSGRLICWGWGTNFEMNEPTSTNQTSPFLLPDFSGVTQGSVGMNLGAQGHVMHAISGDRGFGWANNYWGQVGDGTDINPRYPPVLLSTSAMLAQITDGFDHSCTRFSTGDVYCWGQNAFDQLGLDSTTVPETNRITTRVTTGSAQIDAGFYFTCSRSTTGTVTCWGARTYGKLGDGLSGGSSFTPVATMVGASSWITTGEFHACAVLTTGGGRCWGGNSSGQLGNNTTTNAAVPVVVMGGLSWAQIEAGGSHTCGRTTGGSVYCWGDDASGQLGNGAGGDSLVPTAVMGISGTVVDIAVGSAHSCALTSADRVYCWGRNMYGQIGDGTTINRQTATLVAGL